MAEKLFNLIPGDVGRPISDLTTNLVIEDLTGIIGRVIDSLTPIETEVRDKTGVSYLLRIRPYITLDNTIDGASLVLLELDSIRQRRQTNNDAKSADGDAAKV